MVVDTSALIAILRAEDDAAQYAAALSKAAPVLMSAASYLETGIVVDRQAGLAAGRQVDQLLLSANIRVEPVTKAHADIARQAYIEYGKGLHPAGLNYGNCFSYALAKANDMPLLFKGEDFARTDIIAAI